MKTYYVRFGSGDPRPNVGLAPTFLIFNNYGTGVTPPGITGVIGATGIYAFLYGTTTPIAFLIDGATTGLAASDRYVTGSIDPADRADEYGNTLVAIGTSNIALGTTSVALGVTSVALGTTAIAIGTTVSAIATTLSVIGSSLSVISPLIGSTASSYGSTSVDPVDLFGYMKRIQENLEGNNTFIKTSGALSIYTRGSSTLLALKTIANSASMVTKT